MLGLQTTQDSTESLAPTPGTRCTLRLSDPATWDDRWCRFRDGQPRDPSPGKRRLCLGTSLVPSVLECKANGSTSGPFWVWLVMPKADTDSRTRSPKTQSFSLQHHKSKVMDCLLIRIDAAHFDIRWSRSTMPYLDLKARMVTSPSGCLLDAFTATEWLTRVSSSG